MVDAREHVAVGSAVREPSPRAQVLRELGIADHMLGKARLGPPNVVALETEPRNGKLLQCSCLLSPKHREEDSSK